MIIVKVKESKNCYKAPIEFDAFRISKPAFTLQVYELNIKLCML